MMDSSHIKVKYQELTTIKQSNTRQKIKVFRIVLSVRCGATNIADIHPKSHKYIYK
jgi:hypothetical protein